MSTESRQDLDYSTRGLVADVTASFGGVLLILVGLFDILQGAAAIANDELYAEGSEYLYRLNMTVWGTVHGLIGLVSVVAGVGVLRRTNWGQLSGMAVAGLAMLTNFAFLPRYPYWAILVIALNALVIWALSVQRRHYA